MPFAGHPTLGTAHVCRALGLGGDRLTLELPAGIIPVRATGNRWTLQANAPTWRELEEPRFTLAQVLGLDKEDIAERPLWVSTGVEQLIVPLASEAAVRRVRVRADLLAQIGERGRPQPGVRVCAGGHGTSGALFLLARHERTGGSGHRFRDGQSWRLVPGDGAHAAVRV